MQAIHQYFNPLSFHYLESVQDFRSLSRLKKVIAVAAGIFGALLTPYLLCIGGVALFQLSVKWLKTENTECVHSTDIVVRTKVALREDKIAELNQLIRMSIEERERMAVEEGYLVVTQEDIDNRYTGKGFMRFEDGGTYQGEFLEGKFSGTGTHVFLNPSLHLSCYRGGFLENERSGRGLLLYSEEEGWYEGEFVNDVLLGRGTLRDNARGVTITGAFRGNKVHGIAKASFDNGDLYSGRFERGRMLESAMAKGDIDQYRSLVFKSLLSQEAFAAFNMRNMYL